MGISHARNFSRHKNQLRVEEILSKSILNLGKGGGVSGTYDQYFFLKYIYSTGIKIDEIVYVLSPNTLYADFLNQASNTFDDEPFNLDFFFSYLAYNSPNKFQRLFSYLQTKLQPNWIFKKPYTLDSMDDKLSYLDPKVVEEGQKQAYLNGENSKIYKENCSKIEDTIILANKNNSKIIFFIPPALFGKWKTHDQAVDCIENLATKYDTEVYDFSQSMLDPQSYYDHHHLNTDGVVEFTHTYLKPILSN